MLNIQLTWSRYARIGFTNARITYKEIEAIYYPVEVGMSSSLC